MKTFIVNLVLFAATAALLLTISCSKAREINSKLADEMPPKILWAWEREEDLRFLDAREFGVAFLAQTLVLEGEDVQFRPRRQPLEVAPGTYLIAVTRIETFKEQHKRPKLSEEQKKRVVSLVENTLKLPDVRAVQIDFDAAVSEREFYRALIEELRQKLPAEIALTITSLASWCVGDTWFADFPIDEAVPMAFRMGADNEKIRSYLANGNDWNNPLCLGSYGISIDEPIKANFRQGRRFYYFNAKPWRKSDLKTVEIIASSQ